MPPNAIFHPEPIPSTSEDKDVLKPKDGGQDLSNNFQSSRQKYRQLVFNSCIRSRSSSPPRRQLLSGDRQLLFYWLQLFGQSVDVAIFDLDPQESSPAITGFFQPLLSQACRQLQQLIWQICKQQSSSRHFLLQDYLLSCLVTHWYFVCRCHLLRAWLTCPVNHRGPVYPLTTPFSIGQLLEQLKILSKSLEGQQLIVERRQAKLNLLVNLHNELVDGKKTLFNCIQPSSACQVYDQMNQLLQSKQTASCLDLAVLLEAQTRACVRLLSTFQCSMRSVLQGETPIKPYSSTNLITTKLDQASLLTWLLLVAFISILILFTVFCLPTNLVWFTLIPRSDLDPEKQLIDCFVKYWLLAPLLTWIWIEIKPRLGCFLLTKARLDQRGHETDNRDGLTSLNQRFRRYVRLASMELAMSWNAFEHYENRLNEFYAEFIHQFESKGLV